MMLEFTLEESIALFAIRESEARDVYFLRVVIDVDVLARQNVPVEITVLDLVLPERDGLGVQRQRCEEQRNKWSSSKQLHRITCMLMIGSSCMMRSATSIPEITRPKTV